MKLLKSITIGISPLLAMSFSIAILLSSCAGADNRKSTRKVSTKVHDRKAYALGEEHAANLLKSELRLARKDYFLSIFGKFNNRLLHFLAEIPIFA